MVANRLCLAILLMLFHWERPVPERIGYISFDPSKLLSNERNFNIKLSAPPHFFTACFFLASERK